MSVDGTDFRIQQLQPWSKSWYSYKYNAPGLRYEVGLCILSGRIVWVHGPFPPGDWNDITIFRHSLITFLGDGERVETDAGYRGENPEHTRIPNANDTEEVASMRARVGKRHETINRRFKQFNCLKNVWKHKLVLHSAAFRAIVVITQLLMDDGEPVFDVYYDDSIE